MVSVGVASLSVMGDAGSCRGGFCLGPPRVAPDDHGIIVGRTSRRSTLHHRQRATPRLLSAGAREQAGRRTVLPFRPGARLTRGDER